MKEQEYIDAINENGGEDPRYIDLIYTEYLLEERHEELLAEGWRVLIEQGKKPAYRGGWAPPWNGWNWFPLFDDENLNPIRIQVENTLPESWFDVFGEEEELLNGFPTYYEAMSKAVIAYVRKMYDPDYGKEIEWEVCGMCNGGGKTYSVKGIDFVEKDGKRERILIDPVLMDCNVCEGTGMLRPGDQRPPGNKVKMLAPEIVPSNPAPDLLEELLRHGIPITPNPIEEPDPSTKIWLPGIE